MFEKLSYIWISARSRVENNDVIAKKMNLLLGDSSILSQREYNFKFT